MCRKNLQIQKNRRTFATQSGKTIAQKQRIGRLAQLVQSICLTSRGSAVRIRQRPRKRGRKLIAAFFHFARLSVFGAA